MDDLPEDLLLQVLARLPRCDLLRAKGACRRWRDAACGAKLPWVRAGLGGPREAFLLVIDQATEDPEPPLAEGPPAREGPPIRTAFYHVASATWRNLLPAKGALPPPHLSAAAAAAHPGRRSGFSCVVAGGRLYLLGGRRWQPDAELNCHAWKASADVFVYCPVRGLWAAAPPMLHARADFATAAVGSKIYIAGGVCCAADPREAPVGAAPSACRGGPSPSRCQVADGPVGGEGGPQSQRAAEDGGALQPNEAEAHAAAVAASAQSRGAPQVPAAVPSYDGFQNRFGGRRGVAAATAAPSAGLESELSLAGGLWEGRSSPAQLSSAEVYDVVSGARHAIASWPDEVAFPDAGSCQGQALDGEFVVLGRGFGSRPAAVADAVPACRQLSRPGGAPPRPDPVEVTYDTAAVYVYNPLEDRWRLAGPGPGPHYRKGYGTAVLGSTLVAFGGLSKVVPSWAMGGRLVHSHNPPQIHNSLHVFVPYSEGRDTVRVVSKVCPPPGRRDGCLWEEVSSYKASTGVPLLAPACAEVGGRLLVVGSQERKVGAWEVSSIWRSPQPVQEFDPASGVWSELPQMPYSPVKPRAVAMYW